MRVIPVLRPTPAFGGSSISVVRRALSGGHSLPATTLYGSLA